MQQTGATLLPAKEGKAAQKTASAVLSTGLNATEAIARGFGLKSHAEMRAEAEVAKLAASGATAPPEAEAEPAADDIEAAEKRLAASIAEAEVEVHWIVVCKSLNTYCTLSCAEFFFLGRRLRIETLEEMLKF